MDIDDAISESLTKAIEAALAAVAKVDALSVPALAVPAQPKGAVGDAPNVLEGTVVDEELVAVNIDAMK